METRTFENPVIPAGLTTVNPKNNSTPRPLPTGRVVFDVVGENLEADLQRLYSNAPVGWLDFCKELSSLRQSIFVLKGRKE